MMAYSDEWWKGKHSEKGGGCPDADPAFHSLCGHPDASQPDRYANEEWRGIMRSTDNGPYPDIMEPRAIYYALQSLWTSPPLQESQSDLSSRPSQKAIATCPSTISFGETIQCSIDAAGEGDTYSFSGSTGDVVVVRMQTTSGGLDPQIKLYDSGGSKLYSAWGSYYAAITNCTLPGSGTYTIVADDYGGTDSGNYELSLSYVGFQVNSITPNKGGNTGVVTTTITGAKFESGASVKLTREGNPDINAVEVNVTDSSHITASFDLTGKASGTYDVVVTNPDGKSATLPKAFTIEEGGEAKLWVDIVGRDRVRVGRTEAFIVQYGNSGNINADYPYLVIALPMEIKYEILGNFASLPPDSSSSNYTTTDPEVYHLTVLGVPELPPGSTRSIKLEVNAPKIGEWKINAYITTDRSVIYSSVLSFAKSAFEELFMESTNANSQSTQTTLFQNGLLGD